MLKIIFIILGLNYWSDNYGCHTKEINFKIPNNEKEKDNDYWYTLGREDLDYALNRKIVNNIAKNVIIFLGDGMSITANTASRIFKGQKKGFSGEEHHLVWEKFPDAAFSKTYCIDKQVSGSSSAATAIFGGVKGNFDTLGLNGNVKKGDCEGSLKEANRVHSILKWSQTSGKDTGIVTTTRITHGTPAALYAHSANREWETESDVALCKDIARQLVEDDPGRNINVILAGGRNTLGARLKDDATDGYVRNDHLNLVDKWLLQKSLENKIAKYVTNNEELDEFDPKSVDYLMGLFAGSHLPFSFEREKNSSRIPSLRKLTEIAITRLSRNKNGFFLMVEGGRIDHALHESKPHAAFLDVLEFEGAVEAALKMTNNEDTLIIVTADHSHVMTINGYPDRGHDILGLVTNDKVTDNLPYTTLMFTNGFGANFSWNGEKVVRANLTNVDTRDMNFIFQAAVPMEPGRETHSGEDVGIYATGPMSYLFHRVHEQTYIAHVMAYSACVGPYMNDCKRSSKGAESKSQRNKSNEILIYTSILIILKFADKLL